MYFKIGREFSFNVSTVITATFEILLGEGKCSKIRHLSKSGAQHLTSFLASIRNPTGYKQFNVITNSLFQGNCVFKQLVRFNIEPSLINWFLFRRQTEERALKR